MKYYLVKNGKIMAEGDREFIEALLSFCSKEYSMREQTYEEKLYEIELNKCK